MSLDRRREPELIQPHQDRRLPLQFVDARGQALAKSLGEEVRTIAGDQPVVEARSGSGRRTSREPRCSSPPRSSDCRGVAWR